MSSPLASPAELGVYLGRTDLDESRADLMLTLANDRLRMVVSPVPALAKGIELAVAARVFNNVTSAHQAGIGSAQVSYGAPNSSVGIGGLFVSKSERRDLRALAGRTGAFSVDLLPAEVPPTVVAVVSNIDPDGAATGDLVRVTGYGFTGTTAVTVGATLAEFLVVDDTVIHLVIPAGVAGVAATVVTNAVGVSAAYSYERG